MNLALSILVFSVWTTSVAQANGTARSYVEHLKMTVFRPTEDQPELKVIAKHIHAFLSNPKNQKEVNSPDGQALRDQYRKLQNYFQVKTAFQSCIQNPKNNRQIDETILGSLADVDASKTRSRFSCFDLPTHFDEIERWASDTFQVVSPLSEGVGKRQGNSKKGPQFNSREAFQPLQERWNFESALYDQALKNSIYNLAQFRHRFRSDQGGLTKGSLDQICKSEAVGYCRGLKYEWEIIGKSFSQAQNELKTTPRLDRKSIVQDLNQRIDQINTQLRKASGWSKESPSKSESGRLRFESYQASYVQAASSDTGLLFLTDAIRDRVQAPQAADDTVVGAGGFLGYPSLKSIDIQVVAQALDQAETKIIDHTRQLISMRRNQWESKDYMDQVAKDQASPHSPELKRQMSQRNLDIRELIRTNPAAVGQVLAREPQFVSLVCQAMNSIDQSDQRKAASKDIAVWGGVVGGSVLAVTGVGSLAAGFLFSGTAAAASAATVGTLAAGMGTAVGLGQSAYWGLETLRSKREQIELEQSFLSGATDSKAVSQAQAALSEFREARENLFFNLGFSALDLGVLRGISQLTKVASLRRLSSWGKQLSESTGAGQGLQKAKQILGDSKMSDWMTSLSEVPERLRTRLLEKIASGRLSGQKLAELAQQSLDYSKKNCR